jgi:hypothetical protein
MPDFHIAAGRGAGAIPADCKAASRTGPRGRQRSFLEIDDDVVHCSNCGIPVKIIAAIEAPVGRLTISYNGTEPIPTETE